MDQYNSRDKSYPQRCSSCDRIGYMEDTDSNEWTCKYCGALNKYTSYSRFTANGKLPYVECTCGHKIPTAYNKHGDIFCPYCGVSLHIENTQLDIVGQKSSEVLDVLKGYITAIKESKTASASPPASVSVSGGNVQINIASDNAELEAKQVMNNDGISKED